MTRLVLRFWLGMAQMFAAVVAFVLLFTTGINRVTLLAATIATGLTLASRWIRTRT